MSSIPVAPDRISVCAQSSSPVQAATATRIGGENPDVTKVPAGIPQTPGPVQEDGEAGICLRNGSVKRNPVANETNGLC
jgi:hypothetical protein